MAFDSPPDLPPEFAKGQPLYASRFEMLRKAILWLFQRRIVGVRAPLEMKTGASGTTLGIAMPVTRMWARTTTTITARGSGSLTPGSGTVQPYQYQGTSLVSFGATLTALNFTGSAITTTGTLVLIEFIDGAWWLVSADCSGVAA